MIRACTCIGALLLAGCSAGIETPPAPIPPAPKAIPCPVPQPLNCPPLPPLDAGAPIEALEDFWLMALRRTDCQDAAIHALEAALAICNREPKQ